jgi:putative tryptophan/tyrosine transport system substrate-binding protein
MASLGLGYGMRRRDFIRTVVGSAAALPFAAPAQQPERTRRIGVLLPATADDPEFQARVGAFMQELQTLGWSIGRNVRLDIRWATFNVAEIRRHAAELVALAPDVILAHGSTSVRPLAQATRTVPIVFPVASDPVAAGFVDSLARPGGNITGFMANDFNIGGKWLELLKQIAPSITRTGVLRDPSQGSGTSIFAAVQALAPSLQVEVKPMNVGSAGEIEQAITTFATTSNGGLIVTPGGWAFRYRDLVIAAAARYKLPAIYFDRLFVTAGGLISYGASEIEQYRQAASYVDRILKGEKPADLPVQASNKYETVLNLKTAKALNLAVPPAVLTRADEVIE